MRSSKRRGMLLLIVLALLAMFSMAAITFVIMSGAEKSAALQVAGIGQNVTNGPMDLNDALGALLNNPSSQNAGFHIGVLADMLGESNYSGTLTAGGGGQLLTENIPNAARMVGCNITMTSGAAEGLSSRIVGLQGGQAQVLAFTGATPAAGDSFIVNGFPYGGTGNGYNTATGKCDAVAPATNPVTGLSDPAAGLPLALLPNNPINWNPPGGSNPDYTAPDFQHMFLAYQLPNGQVPIPSFHRSDLIAYMAANNSALLSNSALLRQVMCRPNSIDNPNFTGSNPNFNPTWDGQTAGGGQWDVDNMGLGTPDSVWVDIGFQVRFRSDGKAYKPLVAYLVVDMDGRLNVNAQGNVAQTQGGYSQATSSGNGVTFAGNVTSANLVHGQGTGPAEVNLGQVLPLQSLLTGGGQYPGRYGTDGTPGLGGQNAAWSSLLNWNREFPYNQNFSSYGGAQYTWDAYGNPPDSQAIGSMALDNAGRMVSAYMGGSMQNSPYDIDLGVNAPVGVSSTTPDSPFTASELEAVLRQNDQDAPTLPPRLAAMGVSGHREEITTASFGMAVAPGLLPLSVRGTTLTVHPSDMASGNTSMLPWETQEGLKMNVNRPFDAGARSNQFGNGATMANGATQVVPNQPGLTNEQVTQYVNSSSGTENVAFNYDATGAVADSLSARQLYAQHLYTLMSLVCDTKALDARFSDASGWTRARYLAQWAVNCVAYRDHNEIMIPFTYNVNPLAKGDGTLAHTVWGCKRPALLISETLALHDRRTEDLNNEVIDHAKPGATAQRTKPGYTKNFPGFTPDNNGDNIDPSFNSQRRPQGSLFIELYNPWPQIEARTWDLAPSSSSPQAIRGAAGVELTKVTPQVGGQSSPVWRIIILDPSKNQNPASGGMPDPDNPATTVTIERSAYFVPLTGLTYPSDGQVTYYVSQANWHPIVVPPGGYAVVGSGDATESNRTYIGFESGQTSGQFATSRVVTLNPNDLGNGTGGRVVLNTGDAAVAVNPPQVLGIDSPQRLSVSEPVKGYTQFEIEGDGSQAVLGNAPDGSVTYQTTLDIPPDQQRDPAQVPTRGGTETGIWTLLNSNGTYPAYRIIYLQRLADPTRPFVATGNGSISQWNPYLTVDAMTVDLTTFNGVTANVDPTTPANPPQPMVAWRFESHQRGDTNYLPGSPTEMNLWKQELPTKNAIPASATATAPKANMYFSQPLAQSLGFLNTSYGAPANASGDPQNPFPSLYFAYRPFINEYELMQVPTTSSSQLLANTGTRGFGYGYMDQQARASGGNPYQGATFSNYPHLLNFFDSAPVTTNGQVTSGVSPQFYRILDYVGVPSPYAHMQILARPDLAQGANAGFFHTPFNGISTYREPGRINLNTISSQNVFAAMINGDPQFSNLWNKFLASRRGDTNTDLSINSKLPSRWSRPFRTASGADLSFPISGDDEIDGTKFRQDPTTPGHPLFGHDDINGNTPVQPGQLPGQFANAPVDYNRSAYFRYQGLQRLESVASTHSNVFAIWITVGYFEAIPVAGGPSATYPDGYMLGQELGDDTGAITRHKAFYIFDRSLPVGFIPGQDVNSDAAVLVRRIIQ